MGIGRNMALGWIASLVGLASVAPGCKGRSEVFQLESQLQRQPSGGGYNNTDPGNSDAPRAVTLSSGLAKVLAGEKLRFTADGGVAPYAFSATAGGVIAPTADGAVAELTAGSAATLVTVKVTDSKGASAEKQVSVVTPTLPNDPMFAQTWGMHNTGQSNGAADADIDVPEAWALNSDCSGAVVAVIDTGIDYTHPDLQANIWINPGEVAGNGLDDDRNGKVDDVRGWDFVNNDNAPLDDQGHGTHLAGTIGAVGNNAVGVAGVCWRAKLMPIKVLDEEGSGTDSEILQGINYALQMKTKISNNSYGGGGSNSAVANAINSGAATHLFVAAAGNEANNNDVNPNYPSNYSVPNLIAVAAITRNDALAGFSNFGRTTVHLGAPGAQILSTYPTSRGSYGTLSGTSMATPHVAGAAALAWSTYPSLTVAQVKARLLNSVNVIGALTNRTTTQGRLNLLKAVQ